METRGRGIKRKKRRRKNEVRWVIQGALQNATSVSFSVCKLRFGPTSCIMFN